jgi:hypothetical protein
LSLEAAEGRLPKNKESDGRRKIRSLDSALLSEGGINMNDKKLTTTDSDAETKRTELKDVDLEKVSAGFNPQPDPPGDSPD